MIEDIMCGSCRSSAKNRLRKFIWVRVIHAVVVLLLCRSMLVVRSEENQEDSDARQQQQPRKLNRVSKRGDATITEQLVKNHFTLDFVPECSQAIVEDYDPDDEIRTFITFNGTTRLNAWASDEDFDVAPRYVETFKGIKFASVYKRFARSKQAYGHNYANYNISKSDPTGKTREIFVNADKYGPMCIQPGIEEDLMSENCLYLNIWKPSKWKQSRNTTTICTQKFTGGGRFRKDCEIIKTIRTVQSDGTVTLEVEHTNSSRTVHLGGVYDIDGSIYDESTDVLTDNEDNKMTNDKKKKQGNARTLLELDNTLDDLDEALDDLNDLIKDKENDSEDEKNDEDELSNESTYSVDRTGLLPVMVYIHGGGFMQGSGNDPLFDGSKAAGRGQIIVITLNYRVGVFGFLPTFGWDQWKVNGGMNGFMDIVNALIWIHRNIIKWGGNPNKITVFGPSSSPAVCLLTMCPLLIGKFQRAILTSSIRETEVRDGRYFTRNGVNGASCLVSEQEPYQPLEGRIEIAYKFFDYVNETLYNYPQNPDPSRQDLIDWLSSPAQKSDIMMQIARDEETVFAPQRPAAEFDYNRDGNITATQQRRTFMTWDNDVFPRMPIDLEDIVPTDMIIGVRGNYKERYAQPNSDKPGVSVISKSSSARTDEDNYILLRNLAGSSNNSKSENKGNGTDFEDDDDDDDGNFRVNYVDDDAYAYENVKENVTACGNATDGSETEGCEAGEEDEDEDVYEFDFGGTTSDQDLCVSKQYAEIAARNVKGNVYGYVFDDGTKLFGDRRRQMHEEIEELHRRWLGEENANNHHRFLQLAGFEYDEESIYFFDNLWMSGSNMGGEHEFVKMRKELFNRWINFAKTGNPKYSARSDVESKKYTVWEPFPKGEVGRDPNDDQMPSYLYMPAEPGDNMVGQRKSRMIPLDELVTQRTQKKSQTSGLDMCSWVLLEESDNDGQFVEVLLDFNANTAFDYYVTILATMNPTIDYVPDREYLAELPPTLAPTTIQHFVDQVSSSPPLMQSTSVLGAIAKATVMILTYIALG
mmetsp:Transcript_15999/g.36895  ORF Transcript_15999/g.36895 Transcript_15999/m.36895 type:complete len:1038 (-) Transcript_15999:421-3534(-)